MKNNPKMHRQNSNYLYEKFSVILMTGSAVEEKNVKNNINNTLISSIFRKRII